ncbi:hypothetical protein O6H91_Y220300 [Diphasiastrum complanatum]|nr:hypothetical protein O6H91_Y220300 [Diphasiastrum complanatum]
MLDSMKLVLFNPTISMQICIKDLMQKRAGNSLRLIFCTRRMVLPIEVVSDRHFVAANAITSFKQLVFGYPGGVILVAIQCPNPDFNKNERRQRMVQRALVESVVEVLPQGGKIFLQSDVETVVCQMRREFECYGKGKVGLDIEHHNEKSCDDEGWLKSNPFKVATDWERHVLAKGGQMYRLMLAKMN